MLKENGGNDYIKIRKLKNISNETTLCLTFLRNVYQKGISDGLIVFNLNVNILDRYTANQSNIEDIIIYDSNNSIIYSLNKDYTGKQPTNT